MKKQLAFAFTLLSCTLLYGFSFSEKTDSRGPYVPTQNRLLFEIGDYDHSTSEFALFPNQYDRFLANFGGEKDFYVGYSFPQKHWPYVLPGPLDGWAGGGYWAGYHPRHFPSLYFQIDKPSERGECIFSLFFAGVHKKYPAKLRIEVNGHRLEQEIQGKSSANLLTNKEAAAPEQVSFRFPANWLIKGTNRIQMGIVKGS